MRGMKSIFSSDACCSKLSDAAQKVVFLIEEKTFLVKCNAQFIPGYQKLSYTVLSFLCIEDTKLLSLNTLSVSNVAVKVDVGDRDNLPL